VDLHVPSPPPAGAVVRLMLAPLWRLYMRRARDATLREVRRDLAQVR
jgi:hypothetical protein